MLMKILCTLIAGCFAALVYYWGDIIDNQNVETWVFRALVSVVMLSIGTRFIWMEEE